ncbi:olfactory receptor 5V1-like [Gastrophryne carolinensis]
MCRANQTAIIHIYLLGFRDLHEFKPLLFFIFLLTYLLILGGNLLIVALVSLVHHLKIPMFYFLKHLATADLLLTSSIVPMMLDILFVEKAKISFVGCMIQLYCFGIFGFVQCFLLAVMSYDRYLAICNPLRYASVMSPQLCLNLAAASWFLVTALISSGIIVVCRLSFCGLNAIDHFFCDFGPVVELSSSDTSGIKLQDFIVSIFMLFAPFIFIIVTYIYIFITIVKIASSSGRMKAFSTCSSHIATVCAYYGTLITVYLLPTDENSSNVNKYRSLMYIVVTPLMNPIIYSLRNQEIKKALLKLFNFRAPMLKI